MLTLRHDTPAYAIEGATKAELVEALNDTAYCDLPASELKRLNFTKAHLVTAALAAVELMAIDHERVERAKKEAHDAALADEAANNPNAARIRIDLVTALELHCANLGEVLEDFKAEVAKNPAYAVEWKTERMLDAHHTIRHLSDLRGFARTEEEKPTMLIHEMATMIAEDAGRRIERLIDSNGYTGGSTSSVANLSRSSEYTAMRRVAKITRWVADAIRKDIEDYKGRCEHIGIYLG